MVEFFVAILHRNILNGNHTGYARNIFDRLILPLVDMQRLDPLIQVNKLAFIQMISSFMKFSSDHGAQISLNAHQLGAVFGLIEGIFNHPMLSSDMLLINTQSLLFISEALRLKLINTNRKLLVLEPITDFSYELALQHKSHIASLLVCKIKKPSKDLSQKCNEAIEKMFPLPKGFMPKFGMLTFERKEGGDANTPLLKKKKIKRAMSI